MIHSQCKIVIFNFVFIKSSMISQNFWLPFFSKMVNMRTSQVRLQHWERDKSIFLGNVFEILPRNRFHSSSGLLSFQTYCKFLTKNKLHIASTLLPILNLWSTQASILIALSLSCQLILYFCSSFVTSSSF